MLNSFFRVNVYKIFFVIKHFWINVIKHFWILRLTHVKVYCNFSGTNPIWLIFIIIEINIEALSTVSYGFCSS